MMCLIDENDDLVRWRYIIYRHVSMQEIGRATGRLILDQTDKTKSGQRYTVRYSEWRMAGASPIVAPNLRAGSSVA